MILKSGKFQKEITKKFKRFTFSSLQKKLYSYDLSEPPNTLKKFLKPPEVIVQPESKEEVYEILKLAEKYKKPVVPRGAATSAYGGAIPYKGGIVVDFTRMKRFEIDEDKKLLISEPGVVWWEAQKKLVKKNLSLKVYPTSALSSTVGGWIGQGGYGIGSLKYGSIADNVDWVEVVDFSGINIKEPSKFVGLEGTTGLIVLAALKLKDYDEDVAFAKKADIGESVKEVLRTQAHTAFFYSKKYVEFFREVKNLQIDGDTLLLAFESGKVEKVGDRDVGEALWRERFYPFRIRKVSNFVCVEVVLPIEKLVKISQKIEDPFIVLFTKQNAVLLILLPVEEINYNVWLKMMKMIKFAESYDGRVYSTGLWFSYKSDKVFSNFEVLREYKKKVDRHNLLNPGKIFPSGMLPKAIKLAEKVVGE